MPLGGADPLPKERLRALLEEARERTLLLIDPIETADLERVHSTLMSPLVWDLGHIAAFEDLWLCHRAGGLEPVHPELMEVYDAAETPRAHRGDLPYLRHGEALDYLATVRERAFGVLDSAAPSAIWEMVLQHEHQHNETMLQTMQLADTGSVVPPRPERTPIALQREQRMVPVDAGPFAMGDAGDGFAYDNERPRHEVDLEAFEIDRLPVTNGDYAGFVEDGGYSRPELWSPGGWAWRSEAAVTRPMFWTADSCVRSFERIEPLDWHMPVMHVSWFEADAYARWAGKRLPTEFEWEQAAALSGANDEDRSAATLFTPRPAQGQGLVQMFGDVWQWTQSAYSPYPGYRPPEGAVGEYNGKFMVSQQVLRGSSCVTPHGHSRPTYRNFFYPWQRWQFMGLRLAEDA
jgi:iron(II)-dependent oxidoreductase